MRSAIVSRGDASAGKLIKNANRGAIQATLCAVIMNKNFEWMAYITSPLAYYSHVTPHVDLL